MQTITVNYFELVTNSTGANVHKKLGSETLEDIDEVLIPKDVGAFFVKRFSGSSCYKWCVENISNVGSVGTVPAYFDIFLSQVNALPLEEYLQQTVSKKNISVAKTLWKGTLVEVDYGFVQGTGHIDGAIKSNKRYSDMLQHGEMYKRRLAVVVKAFPTRVQVVPVTSKDPGANDKSCFELSSATLSNLSFYGKSGKQSWVVANMIETVSIRRVLPPSSFFVAKGIKRVGRSTNYTQKLQSNELKMLNSALLHTIGVTDYDVVRRELIDRSRMCSQIPVLESSLQNLQEKYDNLVSENSELKLVKEVAIGWEKHLGGLTLASQVNGLRAINDEIDTLS